MLGSRYSIRLFTLPFALPSFVAPGRTTARRRTARLARSVPLALALTAAGSVTAPAPAYAQDATALLAKHATLTPALARSPFNRPIHLESSEASDRLEGHVFARIDQPFATVATALQRMRAWCDILILHINVKRCLAGNAQAAPTLSLVVGSKSEQSLDQAYEFDFSFKVAQEDPNYLQVALNAPRGPLGTSDYRIVLEASPVEGGRASFLHLSYTYGFGFLARTATQGYLATAGRDKVGFSVIGRRADGQPLYVGGTRGVVERNTMRYYLAIDAYLGALSAPPPLQVEKRLNAWHTGVELYPRQLRELDRTQYLALKRSEIKRQRQASGG